MKTYHKSPDFCAYLSTLQSRAAHLGLCIDDLPGLTGYKLRTVWATLTGSERHFSLMCLRAIESVIARKEGF